MIYDPTDTGTISFGLLKDRGTLGPGRTSDPQDLYSYRQRRKEDTEDLKDCLSQYRSVTVGLRSEQNNPGRRKGRR